MWPSLFQCPNLDIREFPTNNYDCAYVNKTHKLRYILIHLRAYHLRVDLYSCFSFAFMYYAKQSSFTLHTLPPFV